MQPLLLVQGLTLRTAAVGTGQLLRKRQIQLYTDPTYVECRGGDKPGVRESS